MCTTHKGKVSWNAPKRDYTRGKDKYLDMVVDEQSRKDAGSGGVSEMLAMNTGGEAAAKEEYADYSDFDLEGAASKAKLLASTPDLTDEALRKARRSQLLRLQAGRGRRASFLTEPPLLGG